MSVAILPDAETQQRVRLAFLNKLISIGYFWKFSKLNKQNNNFIDRIKMIRRVKFRPKVSNEISIRG